VRGESFVASLRIRRFADDLKAGEAPWLHRHRWPYNELCIHDLIHGTNLNANYGYTYTH